MQTKDRGFTVIELLVVIALVAILAAIAYPRYEAYSTRSEVSDVLKLADKDTQQLANYYAKNGTMPKNKAVAKQAGITLASASDSPYLKSLKYQNPSTKNDDKGAVHLTYTLTHIGAGVNNKTIRLTSDIQNGQLQWNCTSSQIKDEYLPSRCKSKAK